MPSDCTRRRERERDAVKLLLAWDDRGGHRALGVFIGTDREHLALCGRLTLRPDEAEALRLVLRGGIDPRTGIDGIFERGWTE